MQHTTENQKLTINRVILLLAEQRTYYAMFRTGMAMFSLPLTILAFLIGTGSFGSLLSSPFALATVGGILGAVIILGILQMRNSQKKLKKIKTKLGEMKREFPEIGEYII